MSNLYIPLDEVRKIYNRNRYSQKISDWYTESCPNIVGDVISIKAIEELESLPTIDPISIIDEMIEAKMDKRRKYCINHLLPLETDHVLMYLENILRELKSRLSLNKE